MSAYQTPSLAPSGRFIVDQQGRKVAEMFHPGESPAEQEAIKRRIVGSHNALPDLIGVLLRANADKGVDTVMYGEGISDAYGAALHAALAALGDGGIADVAHRYELDAQDIHALQSKLAAWVPGTEQSTAERADGASSGDQQPVLAASAASPAGDTKALSLRVQALGLMQEASAIDGLKPFSVTHNHQEGSSTYLLWAKGAPSEEDAAAVLEADYEPERDESLDIETVFSLEELTGVAVTARLPALLVSKAEEDIRCVVDDVLNRGEEYEFQQDADSVRGAVEESANLLSIDLSEAQVARACELVLEEQQQHPQDRG